jgi:hypothetical protein
MRLSILRPTICLVSGRWLRSYGEPVLVLLALRGRLHVQDLVLQRFLGLGLKEHGGASTFDNGVLLSRRGATESSSISDLSCCGAIRSPAPSGI